MDGIPSIFRIIQYILFLFIYFKNLFIFLFDVDWECASAGGQMRESQVDSPLSMESNAHVRLLSPLPDCDLSKNQELDAPQT